jgi:putative DNA primase/helicase
MATTTVTALTWHDAGICVLPARADGTKAPTVKWTDYQTTQYPRDRVQREVVSGFGLLCGTVSGGLEMVELEGRAVAEDAWQTIEQLAAATPETLAVWQAVTRGPDAYVEATPSGGIHILYRLADAPVPGNTKLASRPARDDELTGQERDVLAKHPNKVFPRVLAETRGEGGYVVVAPSNGATHPTGKPWTTIVGRPGIVPTITTAQRSLLHALMRALDRMPGHEPAPTHTGPATTATDGGGARPGDDFNARTTWTEVLEPHGWRLHYTADNGISYWTRPGKTTGISASTGATERDTLHVFTSSTEFDVDSWHDRFGAYTILNHRGDHQAAGRELAGRGYGTPPDPRAHEHELLAGIIGPDWKARVQQPDTPPPPRPRPTRVTSDSNGATPSRWFKDSALLVETLAGEILTTSPCALTPEQRIAVYRDGAYRIDPLALTATLTRLLGDRFAPKHEANAGRFIAGRLHEQHRYLPQRANAPLLNLRNGLLDLRTGQLRPHTPDELSSLQLPVQWQPDATCPTYEAWLADVIPDQADDLEETFATMLDPSRTPTKAAFLFGPSRSGKSTCLRLAAAIAGHEHTAAVTLHQLADDRFAAANLYGKVFNSAADISAAHIEDMSLFKMLTGEDPINGNRKYGAQFMFTNRALFAFSANILPTVGETSRAYVERIKPFAFTTTFAGREKPEIETRMMAELPGILRRWVAAWQRLAARGHRLETPDAVRAEFEERSDRVRQWVSDRCEVTVDSAGNLPTPGAYLPKESMTTKRDLARAFNAWALEQGGPRMGERKIIERLSSIDGVVEVRNVVDHGRGLNLRVVIDDARVGLLA